MLPLLSLQKISKAFGAQTLFEELSLMIAEREKIGLIGHNGSGKSTLLKIIAGLEHHDDGEIETHRKVQISYLPQNPAFGADDTPQSVVEQALGVQRKRIERYEAICGLLSEAQGAELEKLTHEQDVLHAEIEAHGGWEVQHSIVGMLQKLELAQDVLNKPVNQLSGGQQRRVALARVLLEQPDLLLLDEPTNHLDTATIEWLEGLLKDYRAAVVLVTHDRAFLDAIATRIVELHRNELLSFPGNYVNFVEQKAALLALRRKEQEKYANLLVTELDWLRRAPCARGTKQKARIERVAEIQEKAKVVHENTLTMQFSTDQKLGNIIIQADGISKSYDHCIFKNVELSLRKDDRLAVVGSNGCGKTTLLNVLTKRIEPDTGRVVIGKNTDIAFLSQQRHELDPNKTVYESLGDGDFVYINRQPVHKRGFLSRFLFDVAEQDKLVGSLSGGEKCRILFAKMMCSNANLLVLDEPTNDLDIDSLQTLENALMDYNGAVLFVTHDRYLINKIATAVLGYVPEKQTFIRYAGDYEFYSLCRKREFAELEAAEAAAAEAAARKAKQVELPKRDKNAGKPKKLTFKEQKELETIEETIMEAEAQKEEIEAQIADPANYKIPGRSKELSDSLDAANQRINALYERWEYLQSVRDGLVINPS